MMAFILYQGTYIEVIDQLGFPKEYYALNPFADSIGTVKVDLPRSSFINFYGNVDSIQERLLKPEEKLSYNQGDFNAQIFTNKYLELKDFNYYFEHFSNREAQNKHPYQGFIYEDDEGRLCGCSIFYIDSKKISDHPFMVALIRDINLPPANRTVTFVIHEKIPPVVPMITIESSQLSQYIKEALHSEKISGLIEPLMGDKALNYEAFRAFGERLNVGRNLDDRDVKFEKLCDLGLMHDYLGTRPETLELRKQLMETLNQAYQDVNYFKDKSVDDIELIIKKYKKDPLCVNFQTDEALPGDKKIWMEVFFEKKKPKEMRLNEYAQRLGYISAQDMQNKLDEYLIMRYPFYFLQLFVAPLLMASAILLELGKLTPILVKIGVLAMTTVTLPLSISIVAAVLAVIALVLASISYSKYKEVKQHQQGAADIVDGSDASPQP